MQFLLANLNYYWRKQIGPALACGKSNYSINLMKVFPYFGRICRSLCVYWHLFPDLFVEDSAAPFFEDLFESRHIWRVFQPDQSHATSNPHFIRLLETFAKFPLLKEMDLLLCLHCCSASKPKFLEFEATNRTRHSPAFSGIKHIPWTEFIVALAEVLTLLYKPKPSHCHYHV